MYTLLLGLDAFDPFIFEHLSSQGKLPNLTKLVSTGSYSRFSVSNPPQSEVSWTSIATGADPGVHGIFDFVHRNPSNYSLYVSLLSTRTNLVGTQYIPPVLANTIFDQAVSDGYPATSMWWPATFPARLGSPVSSIPGLGTPDIQGKLGVGSVFTSDPLMDNQYGKTPVFHLGSSTRGIYTGVIHGFSQGAKNGNPSYSDLPFNLTVNGDSVVFRTKTQSIALQMGNWSPIIEFKFKINTLLHFKAITRVLLTSISPELRLYFLPIQIHPLNSPWPYGTPKRFVQDIWQNAGPYLTLGWPQDTTGLEEGWMNDDQFLQLCESIDVHRETALFRRMEGFKEGLLGIVFDSLDRVQHMFLRTRLDIVENWYIRLDALVGRVSEKLRRTSSDQARLIIVSDHGFNGQEYKIHLNRWLINNGYLVPKGTAQGSDYSEIDWGKTQAYAIGLNSLYLNLDGRERNGIVPSNGITQLTLKIQEQLLQWQTDQGKKVIEHTATNKDAFHGPLANFGPDLLIGYAPGFRASSKTGLGGWEEQELEANHDHWGADHCINPVSVPGVLFTNFHTHIERPSFFDIPLITLGKQVDHGSFSPKKPNTEDEDQKVIEDRLKSLGYL